MIRWGENRERKGPICPDPGLINQMHDSAIPKMQKTKGEKEIQHESQLALLTDTGRHKWDWSDIYESCYLGNV